MGTVHQHDQRLRNTNAFAQRDAGLDTYAESYLHAVAHFNSNDYTACADPDSNTASANPDAHSTIADTAANANPNGHSASTDTNSTDTNSACSYPNLNSNASGAYRDPDSDSCGSSDQPLDADARPDRR